MPSVASNLDVLCIGLAGWDLVFAVDGSIAEDQKYRARSLVQSPGGPAANAACLLSQWGLAVALAGHLGEDALGAAVIRDLQAAGVDRSYLRQVQDRETPVSCVLVSRETGARTIVNHRPEPRMTADSRNLPALAPRAILCDGHEPALTALALDSFPEALSVLDAGTYRHATHELAQRVDHAVVSASFATAATGIAPTTSDASVRCLLSLAKSYRARVAITLGARGVAAFDGEGRPAVFAAPPVRAIDTTAAGDIFHGAFVWALLSGRDYLGSIRTAMRTAALSVTRTGGWSSIPDRASALAFCPDWWPDGALS